MEPTDRLVDHGQGETQSGKAIIVKADEVDEAGADISTISPTDGDDFEERIESRRRQDAQATGSPRFLANAVPGPPKPPVRPILRRDSSGIPPPRQPPPPAPPQQPGDSSNPTDSLSLTELKNLVKDLPKLEPTAYAYQYEDTRTFPEELEEWFQYTEEDRGLWLAAEKRFDDMLSVKFPDSEDDPSAKQQWLKLSLRTRESIVNRLIRNLSVIEPSLVAENLECLTYIALGVWRETTLLKEIPPTKQEWRYEPPNDKYRKTIGQLRQIQESAAMICRLGYIPQLYKIIVFICDSNKPYGSQDNVSGPVFEDEEVLNKAIKSRQLNAVSTILYLIIESGRQQVANSETDQIRQAVASLEPSLLHYLSHLIAKLRWDDSSDIPLTKILLLQWKTVLLNFGGTKQLKECKLALRDASKSEEKETEGFLTASPLDYHIFRQEITSKYPAYNPPQPLVPLELNNSSILPPLPNHSSRNMSHDSLHATGINTNIIGKSIFHQPVHISTPAPSPPPSPAGPGGKGGKKQNYQTNQNFPFLYPPLEQNSDPAGIKGNVGSQSKPSGSTWEGSDVPTSIREAGELFASRMRMPRYMRQLWAVREEFLKFERGWEDPERKEGGLNEVFKKLNLEAEDEDMSDLDTGHETARDKKPIKETDNEAVQRRLDAVEDFYRSSLPYLQSIVIVLLKIVLANVTALASQMNAPAAYDSSALPNQITYLDSSDSPRLPKKNLNLAKHLNGMNNAPQSFLDPDTDPAIEDLNGVRVREISSKAISGTLLMLLKWFRLSHVLKFEYLTQLLLDSNYLPLALKFLAQQDVDRAVDQRNDRDDLAFFHFCHANFGQHSAPAASETPASSSSSSDDEAQPLPILRHRRSPSTAKSPPPSPGSSPSPPPRPEVDELGYPTTAQPQAPLTTYAPRFFFTTAAQLRLLQKITKRKAHRALLLVQYKSSTILRRALKIPQPALRLYTLKLFKSQVPYCGRKWRQTNMRVITAIYLHCKPELRDEWISGQNVEEGVEEAVPLEQAGRALVHWWHLRGYKDAMGAGAGEKEESDFFVRELERMGWGVGGGEEEEGGEEEVGNAQGTEWDGGPLQSEGW